MYGSSLAQSAAADEALSAVEEMLARLEAACAAGDAAAAVHAAEAFAPLERLREARRPTLGSLELLLQRRRRREAEAGEEAPAGAGQPCWLFGEAPSIADVALFHVLDQHLAACAATCEDALLAARFPRLDAHRRAFSSLPGTSIYLASGSRHALLWDRDYLRD